MIGPTPKLGSDGSADVTTADHDTELSERELTAYHEAGHAVAVVMRGGSIDSITIDPVPGEYLGITHSRGTQWARSFEIYAGPWAEARSQWPGETLDEPDGDGDVFGDYLTVAFIRNHGTDGSDLATYTRWTENDRLLLPVQQRHLHNPAQREDVWSRELERVWSVICEVATMLLANELQDLPGAQITAIIENLLSGAE